MTPIDTAWLKRHPLPSHDDDTDKNARGRVLVAGGAHFVPGALRLTGEAALRVGAGKLQMATVAEAALPLGVLVPEAAMIAVPGDADGEIDDAAIPVIAKALEHCDAFILGPGMSGDANSLVSALIGYPRDDLCVVLDAAAIAACDALATEVRAHQGRVILTPHHGEMASLTGRDIAEIGAASEQIAAEMADRLNAIIVLKSDSTIIAAPGGHLLAYDGGGIGLATGGSGDVLAGVIGGLAARGADPLTAAVWGVWLHGEAGRVLSRTIAPIGFLARELLGELPALMASLDEAHGGERHRR
ncbi:MAG: NAD(P)H-hydrate dehydratase [Sphingomonadales bacterium]|nr:NAD(P)H-hydrate dehydratase [Sphingomonadales bacterium]